MPEMHQDLHQTIIPIYFLKIDKLERKVLFLVLMSQGFKF